MRRFIFSILFLFPTLLFSQTIDIRISDGLTTEENCFLALAAQQNTINANTVIELRDDVAGVSVNNGITYDNVTFRATLKANKTYKLTASTKHLGSVSNTAATYRWYDVTNATFIGRENQVQSMNSLGNDGDQPFVAAIITPSTDIEVELRCQTVSAANQSMNAFATYAIIEKISELLFSPAGPTSIGNADSLGGQPASFYMDIFTNQNIAGLKVYKDDLVLDSTLSIGISAPDGSSILDITSTTKGLLYPRMTTTQRDNIPSPVTGLSVYNITNNDPNFFNGTAWRRITHAPGSSLEIGSVIFATGVSALDGDSANFFWDTTTKNLKVSGNIKGDTAKFSNYNGIGDTIKFRGHVTPLTDSLYDLGSPTKRWKDLYITSGTIYLGNETLSVDSNGALSFSGSGGISTPSSPPEWLDIQRKSSTNDQTGIDQGTDIILDSANGNIPYNSTTGVVTLKAGKVYVLWFTVAAFSIGSSETVAIQWVKASDNTPLYEGHETRLRPQSSSSNGNNQPTIKIIYKPTVDTDVKLRCTEYTGTPDTVTMYWDRSFATINELR
ncbi:MAG: hypothetical protein ACUZ8E_05650 [Candidatus Anammoxibacter sp.]